LRGTKYADQQWYDNIMSTNIPKSIADLMVQGNPTVAIAPMLAHGFE
jgi:hypothetical protein